MSLVWVKIHHRPPERDENAPTGVCRDWRGHACVASEAPHPAGDCRQRLAGALHLDAGRELTEALTLHPPVGPVLPGRGDHLHEALGPVSVLLVAAGTKRLGLT